MARYRFIKTGNFVDFYDQAMHVIKLHDTSRCITWTFDDTVGVNFKIDEMIYHSDLMSEISFDGVACTSHADFKAGILAMFPDMAGGGEGGATPGIDDVLAEDPDLTTNRSINLNGKSLNITGGTQASGNAGNISIVAPAATGENDAGNVIITGGKKGGNAIGGDVIITSGGADENDPGTVFIAGANATSQGKGGIVNVTGGNAEGASESGGDVLITGGNGGVSGQGGRVNLAAGSPGIGGDAGTVSLLSSSGNETGNGGDFLLQSGNGGATSGNGGNMNFIAGNALGGDGNGGDVVLNTGEKNGSGTFGKFKVNYTSGGDPEPMIECDPSTQLAKYTMGMHTFEGNFKLLVTTVPGAANATGETGQISWDSDHFYVCVAPDTWVRTTLITW